MADNDLTEKAEPPSIPDFELLRPIGSGSYGEVWLARSLTGQYRGIKIVRRSRFTEPRPFEREFSGIQKYEPISRSHEGLVSILHVGKSDEQGFFYYVMELADDLAKSEAMDSKTYVPRTAGRELRSRGKLTTDECLKIGLALCGALSHLHKNGLVHRDIKPSNIIFVNAIPKLADIGLVAAFDECKSFVGTEGFVPPEGPGTPRADMYALGKVLYELSTGRDRQDFPELPSDLAERDDQQLWVGLNRILLKACHSDASQGYKSAQEFQEDLARLLDGKAPKPEPFIQRKRLVTAAAVVALIVCIGFFFLHDERKPQPPKPIIPPPLPQSVEPLRPPTQLTAIPVSSTEMNVMWADNSDDEDGFIVERRKGESGEWVRIATVASNVTWYQDRGLAGYTTYFYRVHAFNSKATSEESQQVNATTNNQELKNVALAANGTTASANSVGSYEGFTGMAERAIDGNPNQAWTGTQIPGWLIVKFDRVSKLERIGIWFGSHKHTFSVSTSVDGATWTTVITSRESKSEEYRPPVYENFAITPTDARYVRIDITRTSAPTSHIFQAVVQELEAYTASTNGSL